ncbi:uncharacterized protein LOC144030825 isoform X1 [Festucalex cinctus]
MEKQRLPLARFAFVCTCKASKGPASLGFARPTAARSLLCTFAPDTEARTPARTATDPHRRPTSQPPLPTQTKTTAIKKVHKAPETSRAGRASPKFKPSMQKWPKVRLTCTNAGDAVQWWKDNQPLTIGGHITATGDKLNFGPVKMTDKGEYKCGRWSDAFNLDPVDSGVAAVLSRPHPLLMLMLALDVVWLI